MNISQKSVLGLRKRGRRIKAAAVQAKMVKFVRIAQARVMAHQAVKMVKVLQTSKLNLGRNITRSQSVGKSFFIR